jgi:hypothetical protein
MKKTDENRNGLRVPEDYFASFDTRLMTRLKADSKKGMNVPEGYFEDFEVKPPGNRPDVRKLVWLAAAASILLFFGVKYMDTNQTTLDWTDLEQEEIGSWIESDLMELNAFEIAEAYPDVELNAPNLSNEELNAYLNETELEQILYEN